MKRLVCVSLSVIGVGVLFVGALLVGSHAKAEAPPGHFTENAGTITDAETGLTWQKTPSSTTYTWSEAETYCASLMLNGSSEWRLPTLLELHSIIDSESIGNIVLDTHFDIGPRHKYWSKTRDPHLPAYWVVDVQQDGASSQPSNSPSSMIVRCVR
jgi:hypothetical protein